MGERDSMRWAFQVLRIVSTPQGSIGWATGCVLGASYAARDQNRRCVLFTGSSLFTFCLTQYNLPLQAKDPRKKPSKTSQLLFD